MHKLLFANLSRLWRNKIFWIVVFIMAFSGFIFNYYDYQSYLIIGQLPNYHGEDGLFNVYPLTQMACGICISLFLGIEHGQGGLRRKLSVGASRINLYLSNLIVSVIISAVIQTAHLLIAGICGYLFFGSYSWHLEKTTYIVFCCYCLSAAYASVFMVLAANISNRVVSIISCVGVSYALAYISAWMHARLGENEFIRDIIGRADDMPIFGEPYPNPLYVEGFARTVMEFFHDLLPSGQTNQITYLFFDRYQCWPLMSLAVFLLAGYVGYIIFKKKDIK